MSGYPGSGNNDYWAGAQHQQPHQPQQQQQPPLQNIPNTQQQSYNFDMPEHFGQEL